MSVNEQDRAFLSQHNFDAEDSSVKTQVIFLHKQLEDRLLLIDGFIEGHPGEQFSPADVSRETGLNVELCKAAINNHPLAEKARGFHKHKQYHSIASPLVPSPAELGLSRERKNILGVQAQEDWFYLINRRRLQLKHKIVRRF